MGNNSRRVEKGKALAPPPPAGDKEEERRVLEEKLHRTRLELQRMLALSADADETISKLIAEAQRVKKERDEEYVKFKMLQAELRARRNAQAQAMTMARGGYGNRALLVAATFGTQEQYYTGASYYFAPSSPHTSGQASFDPDMFLANAAGGDSVVPTMATGSGQLVSELGLVAEQILRLPWKKEEVVEAPVRQKEEEDEDKTDADTSVADDKDE